MFVLIFGKGGDCFVVLEFCLGIRKFLGKSGSGFCEVLYLFIISEDFGLFEGWLFLLFLNF